MAKTGSKSKVATIKVSDSCLVTIKGGDKSLEVTVMQTNASGVGMSASNQIVDEAELKSIMQAVNAARK